MDASPQAIKHILKKYHSTLDKRAELPAFSRIKIYKNIENISINPATSGYYLRAKLELSCALKVLGNWEYYELNNGSARELLARSEQFLHGEGEIKKL